MNMNALIRRHAGITTTSVRPVAGALDLDTHITVDVDQGQRHGHVRPPISNDINTRIRRAAGISIRPNERAVPETDTLSQLGACRGTRGEPARHRCTDAGAGASHQQAQA